MALKEVRMVCFLGKRIESIEDHHRFLVRWIVGRASALHVACTSGASAAILLIAI
jgi:hypothetical protein